MARTPLLRDMVDRALEPGLTDFLQTRRDRGDSYATIAGELLVDHQINVTAETLRVWCNDLGVVARPTTHAEAAS
jgi:hypothetical protein